MVITQAQINSQGYWSYAAPGTATNPVWVVYPSASQTVQRICTQGVTGDSNPALNPICLPGYGSGVEISPNPGETQSSFMARQQTANALVSPSSTFTATPISGGVVPVVQGVSTTGVPSWLSSMFPPSLPPSAINTPLPSPMTPGATPAMNSSDGVTLPVVGTVNIWLLAAIAVGGVYLLSRMK